MKRWIKRIWQTALAALVVASLGVGVTQLQATARALDHCFPPPEHHGHCASEAECDEICEGLNFNDGFCDINGCCTCFL